MGEKVNRLLWDTIYCRHKDHDIFAQPVSCPRMARKSCSYGNGHTNSLLRFVLRFASRGKSRDKSDPSIMATAIKLRVITSLDSVKAILASFLDSHSFTRRLPLIFRQIFWALPLSFARMRQKKIRTLKKLSRCAGRKGNHLVQSSQSLDRGLILPIDSSK